MKVVVKGSTKLAADVVQGFLCVIFRLALSGTQSMSLLTFSVSWVCSRALVGLAALSVFWKSGVFSARDQLQM